MDAGCKIHVSTISSKKSFEIFLLNTLSGNKIDYYHFYIELPEKKPGEKKRSSPNFRKEAYKMDDYTLVAYIGDHNIVEKREETLKQKRDKILGSLSMHANLQQMAKNRTNVSKISGVREIPGRGYNTISGIIKKTFLEELKPFSPFISYSQHNVD